jgi:hypothetical protein
VVRVRVVETDHDLVALGRARLRAAELVGPKEEAAPSLALEFVRRGLDPHDLAGSRGDLGRLAGHEETAALVGVGRSRVLLHGAEKLLR